MQGTDTRSADAGNALRRAAIGGAIGVEPVSVRELSKRYGEVVAVDALTFSLAPGTVTGFLGPNGAGETTTLPPPFELAGPLWRPRVVNTCAPPGAADAPRARDRRDRSRWRPCRGAPCIRPDGAMADPHDRLDTEK